jgi:Ran GTPase-activating protein (RanGAP) involved in mRNA processing and transport
MEKNKSTNTNTKLPNINQPFKKKPTYINFESLNSLNNNKKESNTPPPKTPSDKDDSFTIVENEKLMIQVFNSDKTHDMISEFILNENRSIKDQAIFNKTKYSSIDSHETFYNKYKNFTNIKRKGLVQIKTPSFEYIKACNSGMLVPNPLGLISRKGNENQLFLKNQKIGDNYLKALSEGLKYSDHLDELYLSSNRLTFYGVNPLMTSMQSNQKLSKMLRVLDLSFNKIGSESVKKIVNFIANENCELQRLNLEGNSIGDEMIIKLCESISRSLSGKLNYINFGKNLISDESAPALSNLIANCHIIEEMILCWNNLRNFGASLIFNKLRKHNEMKIFDISWNSIGNYLVQETSQEEIIKTCNAQRTFYNLELNDFRKTNVLSFKKYNFPNAPQQFKDKNQKNAKETTQKKEVKPSLTSAPIVKQISSFAKELGEYFKEPAIQLVHLDISHNNIPREDCEHLAHCVKSNHTILGIHVDGNEMTIDSLGFLHTYKDKKKEDYYAKSQIYYQIGSSQGKSLHLSKLKGNKVRKIRAKNNCWICEGWREVEIKFFPPKEICDYPGSHHVKMHLNCDDWKQFDTICTGNSYFNTRMCPPGDLQYIFSIDKNIMTEYGIHNHELKEGMQFHFDHEYIKEFENLQLMMAYTKQQENEAGSNNENNDEDYEEDENQDNYIIKKVGNIHVDINRNVLDEYNRKTMKYCLPRPKRNFNKFIKPRTPWTFAISLWANFNYEYEGDSEQYIDEVFENDFSRVLKDKDEIRPILRENYRKM